MSGYVASGCVVCGNRTKTIDRASGGQAVVLEAPTNEGDLLRLPNGPHAGQYVRLGGKLLDMARADERTLLYLEHACVAVPADEQAAHRHLEAPGA